MINNQQLHSLISAINENSSKHVDTTNGATDKTMQSGAVWHGDWTVNADDGKFGQSYGPQHFAMILWNKKLARERKVKSPAVRLAPITSSKKSGKRNVLLPAGELRTSRHKDGYILPQIKLIIRKSKLVDKFDFKQFLDTKYVEQCKEALNNG